MIFDALGRLALGEVPDDAGPEAEQPSFVAVPLNRAVKRASVIALVGGLVFVPAPPAAPAAVGAWQNIPSSRAVNQPLYYQSSTQPVFVPAAQATVTLASTHTSVPLGRTLYYQATIYAAAPPVADNNQDISKWQQPLSSARPRPPVHTPPVYVFRDTAFTQNTVDIGKWQQPLGKVPPRTPVWPGLSLVPFDTTQVVANTIDYSLYQQPLSKAVPIPRAAVGITFVPFDTAQQAAAFPEGWQSPAQAAPARRLLGPPEVRPFAVEIVAEATVEGWQHLPSSRAISQPLYYQSATVPIFTTAEASAEIIVTLASTHTSVPLTRVLYYKALTVPTPYPVEQAVVADVYGWWQPLSRARDIPRGPVGFTVVPFDTAQRVVVEYGWQQPLSQAAAKPPVWAGGPSYTFLSTQFTQNTVNWGNYQQPLSRPAAHPPVWQGTSVVPFDTAQIIFNTIDYSLYMQPLSRAVPIPYTTFTVGYVFVPWDTVQVIPPPRPGGVQPPGFWYEEWERIADRQRKRKRPAPELIVAVDELPQDWQPSKVFKVSPRVIEALAQAQSIDDIRELARQETGQVRNMLNMVIAEYKRRVKDEDDIEIILMTMH